MANQVERKLSMLVISGHISDFIKGREKARQMQERLTARVEQNNKNIQDRQIRKT